MNLATWLAEVNKSVTDPITKLLVGNKCDLVQQRRVSQQEAAKYAADQNMQFLETSAKTNVNVDRAFTRFETFKHFP